MTYAIITAAGKGTRANLSVPKQFYEVNGKPLIIYTLNVFESSDLIDSIVLVVDKTHIDFAKKLIEKFHISKVKFIVEGGDSNQLSIFNGLKAISGIASDDDFVVIHDGVRCLVSQDIIRNNLDICKKFGNAITAIGCNEAMLFSNDGVSSEISLSRETIFKTQTPHSIKFKEAISLFNEAFEKGKTKSVALCTLLIEFGKKVYFSQGSALNFKITQPDDIALFQGVLNEN